MSLNIRPVKVSDASAIYRIHKEAVSDGTFIQTIDEFQETIDTKVKLIESFNDKKNSGMFVVELNDDVVGWLILRGYDFYRLKHVAMLGMAIKREHRGKQIGTKLVQFAVDWAKSQTSLKRIALAVFATNKAGIKIYEKAGFILEGTEKNEVRLDDGTLADQLLMAINWE